MYDMYVFDCLWLSFHQLSFSHHSCITDFNWQIQGTDDLNHFTCMLHQMVRSSVRSPARLILYSSCTHPILLFFCRKFILYSSTSKIIIYFRGPFWVEVASAGQDHAIAAKAHSSPGKLRERRSSGRTSPQQRNETNETKWDQNLSFVVLICWFVDLCCGTWSVLKMIPRSIPWKLQSYRPIPGLSLVAN